MSPEWAPVLVVPVEPFHREEAAQAERRVQGRRCVTLRKDEPVAHRVLGFRWVDPKDLAVEYGKNVGDRETGRDMRRSAPMGHKHSPIADGAGEIVRDHGALQLRSTSRRHWLT